MTSLPRPIACPAESGQISIDFLPLAKRKHKVRNTVPLKVSFMFLHVYFYLFWFGLEVEAGRLEIPNLFGLVAKLQSWIAACQIDGSIIQQVSRPSHSQIHSRMSYLCKFDVTSMQYLNRYLKRATS